MPCDYRILQSPTKGQVNLVLWETVQQSLLDGIIDYDKKMDCAKTNIDTAHLFMI